MSQENVEVVRRWWAFVKTLGGRIEADEVADRLPDTALGEFLDPKLEYFPIPQGVLGGSTFRGFDGFRRWAADFVAVGMRSKWSHRNFSTAVIRWSASCE